MDNCGVVVFEGKRYSVAHGETALEALVRGGADVKFSCRKGTCRTCLLQVVNGSPPDTSTRNLEPEQRQLGLFTPCTSPVVGEMTVQRPDLSTWRRQAKLHSREQLAPGVFRLLLEATSAVDWEAGQYISIHNPSGASRCYSLASIRENDYFLELQVKRIDRGEVSTWLVEQLAVGEELTFYGPLGSCFYTPAMQHRRLLLVGTGTGISPLVGIARQALRSGHSGGIFLYHGSRREEGQYLASALRKIEASAPTFRYTACVSEPQGVVSATAESVTDIAFAAHSDLRDYAVFLCGKPEMVYSARVLALAAGAGRAQIYADPFEPNHRFEPNDKSLIDAIVPDPELWQGLGNGVLLKSILEDFYTRVYDDPELSPFFHRVTKERAVGKQYEFLRDMMTGSRNFFGPRPFNAHHWMIISDELFDYREDLLVSCMSAFGLAPRLIWRWAALHERFRRSIVKSVPRGLILNGQEVMLEGFTSETLSIGSVCDGCQAAIATGSVARMHRRTGELFCEGCEAPAELNDLDHGSGQASSTRGVSRKLA